MLATPWDLWVRALHVIGFVVWMGGLLYLTSLLARAAAEADPTVKGKLYEMGRGLYFRVALPGLGVTFAMGVLLIVDSIQGAGPESPSVFKQGWFHAKLLAVIVLLVVDHLVMRGLKRGPEAAASGRFRAYHVLSALLLVAVVVLTKVVGGV